MKRLLKHLSCGVLCAVIGAVCAWLVLNREDPYCHFTAMAAMADMEENNRGYLDQINTLRQTINDMMKQEQATTIKVKALESAARSATAELAEIRQTAVRQTAEVQQITQQWREQNGKLLNDLKTALDERDQFKTALKAQRADYIQLANKNAALEVESIKELAARHQEGTKVSRSELAPIMQAIVDTSGIPAVKNPVRVVR